MSVVSRFENKRSPVYAVFMADATSHTHEMIMVRTRCVMEHCKGDIRLKIRFSEQGECHERAYELF